MWKEVSWASFHSRMVQQQGMLEAKRKIIKETERNLERIRTSFAHQRNVKTRRHTGA